MKALSLLFSAAAAASILGCESSLDTPTQDSINESGFFAKFNPSDGTIPFPNNLLFDGNSDGVKDTTYGKLEIPIPAAITGACDNSGEIALKTALNDLDGFSTVAPISTSFSSAIDASSLVVGDTVRVFEVTLSGVGGVVTSITGELTATDVAVSVSTVDNEVDSNGCASASPGANKLVISPLKPLNPKSNYLVALTNDIKGTDGNNAAAETVYAFAKSSDALVSTFPATNPDLSEVVFPSLLSTSDTNGNGTIDAGEVAGALTTINGLEGLRQFTNVSEGAIENYTITADAGSTIDDLAAADIVLSWTFTTQSIDDALVDLQAVVAASSPASVLVDVGAGNPLAASDLFAGTLTTNYYLNTAATVNDPSPLAGSWRGAGDTSLTASALATTTNTTVDPGTATSIAIPLLASIPNGCGAMPVGGWPVVIFQHGITRNRTDMLTVADTFAASPVCYAVVAIDMPLHGLSGNETDGTENFFSSGNERTFELDLVNNTTGAPGADLVTDDSGKHYINLTSLLTTRDNVRQSVADLYVLTKALETMNTTTGGHSFDPNNIYFVGHSLGGMVGAVFLATEPNVKSAVLAMAGGGIAKLLDGSAAFGPEIAAGLAANGINKGFAQYEEFLASAQMFIDSADPINFAASTGMLSSRGLLLMEVVGDGADNLPDQTVPNNVIGVSGTVNAPLSGTDPLAATMGLTTQNTSTTGTGLDLLIRFTDGHHGSILTQNDAEGVADTGSAAVYTEMHSQMSDFISNDGGQITITDTSIVE